MINLFLNHNRTKNNSQNKLAKIMSKLTVVGKNNKLNMLEKDPWFTINK